MKWPMVPFGEILRLAPRELVGQKNLPVMSITMSEGLIDQHEKFKKRIASKDISTYKVVHFGNLVVGFPIDEGVLGFQQRYESAAVSPAYDIWEISKKHEVDRGFFERILRSPISRAIYRSKMRGTTNRRRTIPKDVFRKILFPLPPFAEQKRIAKILDAADALRAKRRESLAQLDTLLQSTFLDMFGDPVTNPKGWEIKPLGELGTLDRGVSKHRPRNEPSLLGGVHPLIQTGDVSNSGGYIRTYTSTYSDLGLKQSEMWPAGTLCITIAANIANTGILTFDACFPDSIVGFSSEEKGRVEYVQGLFWFFKDILDRKAPQVAQKNINLKILRNLPVPFPIIYLQQRFAEIVEAVEKQKELHRSHLAELDTLFAALQQRAFNGGL